jgi:hypothetical protein
MNLCLRETLLENPQRSASGKKCSTEPFLPVLVATNDLWRKSNFENLLLAWRYQPSRLTCYFKGETFQIFRFRNRWDYRMVRGLAINSNTAQGAVRI